MKHQPLFYLLLLAGLLWYSCTPDCSTYTIVEAAIEPELRFPGDEILVKTVPSDFLRNRELYMSNSANNAGGVEMIVSTFNAQLGGRIAVLDNEFANTGTQQVYVQDDDCGGLLALEAVNVVDDNFRNLNPNLFVTPTPSIIIIPPPPAPSPPSVINTWFSPDDPAYCIWFLPQIDTLLDVNGMDSCYFEHPTLEAGDIALGTGTRELRCGGTDMDLDHNNPITGFINQMTGQVRFAINREAKGLGIETFVGHLVDPSGLPGAYRIGGRCLVNPDSAPTTMMAVTSELTGRMLILYRDGPPDFVDLDCE